MTLANTYLDSIKKRFLSYKQLGDKTFEQLSDEDILWKYNEASNSIAVIVNHLSGNMLSRWTDFLNSDGEKPWRQRDEEFENHLSGKKEMMAAWEKGWQCLIGALEKLQEEDLTKTIYIRSEPLIVADAINRQLAHYAYHVGQIIFIGKMRKDDQWKSLSIPKGESKKYNEKMLGKK